MNHDVKTWADPFQAVCDRRKLFDIRRSDRDYNIGDTLTQWEYDPITKTFSGRWARGIVSYLIERPFGLSLCLMSLVDIESGRVLVEADLPPGAVMFKRRQRS